MIINAYSGRDEGRMSGPLTKRRKMTTVKAHIPPRRI